jgi:hypothetical protein
MRKAKGRMAMDLAPLRDALERFVGSGRVPFAS